MLTLIHIPCNAKLPFNICLFKILLRENVILSFFLKFLLYDFHYAPTHLYSLQLPKKGNDTLDLYQCLARILFHVSFNFPSKIILQGNL